MHSKIIKSIIFIIISIILLIPLISDLYYYSCDKTIENINNIKFKTGDLLFCRYNNYNIIQPNNNKLLLNNYNLFIPNPNKIFSSITGYYSHISMIVVINKIPYIYDITYQNNDDTKLKYDNWSKKYVKNKPALLAFSYIHEYCGDIYHIPYIGPMINHTTTENILNKYKNYKFDIYNSIFNKISLGICKYNNKKVSCTILISNILSDMGIIDVDNKQSPTIDYIYNECIRSNKYLNSPKIINYSQTKYK